MTEQMSEEELDWRMIDAAKTLIAAAKHYGKSGVFVATCTDENGERWQIIVRPGMIVPVASITPPVPVAFSLN